MDEPEQVEGHYALVFPFVACKSNGGPYDDDAFVAGYRLGRIDAVLQATKTTAAVHHFQIHPEEAQQLDLIAMHHGYDVDREHWDDHPDEWMFVTLTKAEMPS